MSSAIEHLAVLAHNYPSPAYPNRGTFVEQLVHAVARQGVRCTVIHPHRLHEWIRERRYSASQPAASELPVELLRPAYCSLSSRNIGPWNSFAATQWFFTSAAWRAVRAMERPPQAMYGHFLYSGGAAAVRIGKRLGIPSFVAVGEGSPWTINPLGIARAVRDIRGVTGVMAVSTRLRRWLMSDLEIPADKIAVFPNGVDHRRFYPRDRAAMRAKLGLPQDKFLVAYVGFFTALKGAAVAAAAIEGLDGVGGLFVGSGPLAPQGPGVLFRGAVPHHEVPELMSAADAFVMPSLVEGCCNAILEAMACGLPIVASNGEYNDDILNDEVAIRVEPRDVAAIRRAIVQLRDNRDARHAMSERALAHSARFDVDARAAGILKWINERCEWRRARANAAQRDNPSPVLRQGAT